ncbi:hypothetical protein D9M70_384730 [compost metagenome]
MRDAQPRHFGQEVRGLELVEQHQRRAQVQVGLHQHAGRVRDRADQRQPVARPCGTIHAGHHLAQRRHAVAVGLHRCLDLAGGAGREVQHGEVAGSGGDVGRGGAGVGQQRFIADIACGRFTDGDERLHAGKARRGARVAGVAGAGDQHARRAVLDHVAGFRGGKARIQRRLDQAGLVQRALQLDQLGPVARLYRHAVAALQPERQQRVGQAGGALFQLAVGHHLVLVEDGGLIAPIARGAAQEVRETHAVSVMRMMLCYGSAAKSVR